MSLTYTLSESQSFTVTHARHMAAKVATDLKRIQRFYGLPSDFEIARYEREVIALLTGGYLGTVTYGFRRNGRWIVPTVKYTAKDLAGMSANDDDPGRIPPGAEITGASFYSYLDYNPAWDRLSGSERESFEERLPFRRRAAPEPGIDGYLSHDRTYSAGGRALERASVRSYR